MRTALLAVLACCTLACDNVNGTADGDGARRPIMVFDLGEGLSFRSTTTGYETYTGDYAYWAADVETDAPTARLELMFGSGGPAPDGPAFYLVAAAPQRATIPIGRRYLDEADLGAWGVEGTIGDVPYVGTAMPVSLHLDLKDGSLYFSLDLNLEPLDGVGSTYAGRVDGKGVQRLPVYCDLAEVVPGPRRDAQWEQYCAPIRDAIAAVPDDPAAPPPPWDPDDDSGPCDGCAFETAPPPQ